MAEEETLLYTHRFTSELKQMMINHTLDLLDTNVELQSDVLRTINNMQAEEILSLYLKEHSYDDGIIEVLVNKVNESLDLPF